MKIELDMTLDQQRAKPKKHPTAGQPRKADKKIRLTIRLRPELLANIHGNRSAFIEKAIIDKLNA